MDWLQGQVVAFGTSGVRGPARSFDAAVCSTLVQGFLRLAGTGDSGVLVGHDLRESSPPIAGRCIAACVAQGRSVRFAGVVPTPALAWAARQSGAAAIMVTGSHIAGDRNGLKFFIGGREISKDEERSIAGLVVAQDAAPPENLPQPDDTVSRAYVQRYLDAFPGGPLAGLRLGVYEHASVSRDLLHEVLQALGAETVALDRRADFAPLDTEALPDLLRTKARAWAEGGTFHAIVSADADGDRPLLADETGDWIRGDRLGAMAALACGAQTVVTPVTSSSAIEMCGAFRDVVRTRIGSPHVIAAMQGRLEPVVGFEANGGFLLGSALRFRRGTLAALPTRDAVLPMLLVLVEANRTGQPVSALSARLPQRHSASGRIEGIAAPASQALIDTLSQDLPRAALVVGPSLGSIVEADFVDGLRCRFQDGTIVHLRASGNAPELRCYAEAETSEAAEKLTTACLARLAALF